MFNGERRKLSVGDKIAADIQFVDQLSEDVGSPL